MEKLGIMPPAAHPRSGDRGPSFEHRAQLSVEDLDTSLQEQMGAAFAPLHLRCLAEPLAHDLVDR